MHSGIQEIGRCRSRKLTILPCFILPLYMLGMVAPLSTSYLTTDSTTPFTGSSHVLMRHGNCKLASLTEPNTYFLVLKHYLSAFLT